MLRSWFSHYLPGLRCTPLRLGAMLLLLAVAPALPGQFSGPAPLPSPLRNTPMPLTADPAVLYPGEREVELGPGDQIGVHIFDAPDYTTTTRVGLDGSVQIPLAGVVHVGGLPLQRAEELIASQLVKAGMFRNPQVTIELLESPNQIITVIGEVHAIVPALGGHKRLYDVLAAAGGLPNTASHLVAINRPGQAEPILIDLGPDPARSNRGNIPVFARDTIVVSRVGVVYVLGAFKIQGAIPIQPSTPLTLMQATSLGGGAGFQGKYDDLRIVRTIGLERRVIRVDLQKIQMGKAPDPVLQADDVVFLPSSSVKAAIKSNGISIILSIVSVLFYAANAF